MSLKGDLLYRDGLDSVRFCTMAAQACQMAQVWVCQKCQESNTQKLAPDLAPNLGHYLMDRP